MLLRINISGMTVQVISAKSHQDRNMVVKYTTMPALVSALSKAFQIDTGFMDPHIIRMRSGDHRYLVAAYDGGKIRTVEFDRESLTIPTPPTLFFLAFRQMQNGLQLTNTRVACVQDFPVTDQTPLYAFPFFNVYRDTGVVCWGDVRQSTYRFNLTTGPTDIINAFWHTRFSPELAADGAAELIHDLEGKTRFPLSVLRGLGKSFQQMWSYD